MKITVAAFYADIPGQLSRLGEYLPLALASRRALAGTNPGARYVVLTDRLTAPALEAAGLETEIVAPEHMALMSKVIFAQAMLLRRECADLVVLPDIDCLANRALADGPGGGAIAADVGLVVTHKGPKFARRINNLAYVRDAELGDRFLQCAYRILDGWPLEARLWGGDQDAWGAALGPPGSWEPLGDERFIARPDWAQSGGRPIHVYPCATHNCPLADNGKIKRAPRDAYFVHLKGPRKQHLEAFMAARFGSPP